MSDLNYKCANPKCGMDLLNLNPTSLVAEKPSYGDLLVCGACNSVNGITLTGTRLITQTELDQHLTDDEQKDLRFAKRASKRDLRN